jgi:cyclophilin family peptidyl-prolyl cis-trans isomerase
MLRTRTPKPHRLHRRACFETLESRQLLSVTLETVAETVSSGAPLSVALNSSASGGHAVSYSVAVHNSTMSSSKFTATVPQGNVSMKVTVDYAGSGVPTDPSIHGDMVFQLDQDLVPQAANAIANLVSNTTIRSQPFYNGLTFHRIYDGFMIQGGDPSGDGTGGPGYKFDDQYNSSLQFTSSGILALANSGADTNGSQFFITTAPFRDGDFRYTIIGFMTEGAGILNQLQSIPTHSRPYDPQYPDPNDPYYEKTIPDSPAVTMTTVTTFADTQNGVLRLSAQNGTTGTADVIVTATDSVTHATISTQTFDVTVVADTNNDRPYLGPISPIHTSANTPVTFDLPGIDVEGNTRAYGYDSQNFSPDMTLTGNFTTGHLTLTPLNGVVGVFDVGLGVRASTDSGQNLIDWDIQDVPIYIDPAAPTGVTLISTYDTGASQTDRLTNLNNTAGKTLQFQVDGVIAGADVKLFAGGVLIGERTASDTSITITTNGTATLADGANAITATQTLMNQTVNVGNLNTTVNLASAASSALTITVDATAPQFIFAPATKAAVAVPYTAVVKTASDASGPLVRELTEAPTGMAFDATSGQIAWTPTDGQGPTENVTIRATDAAGNITEYQFAINIVPSDQLTPEVALFNGTTEILAGQTSPIDLGSVVCGSVGPNITLTIRNQGGQPLALPTAFANTSHFTVSQPAVTTLQAGESTTFTVTLNTSAVWSGSETVSFANTDADNGDGVESPFTFTVSGTVTLAPHDWTTPGAYDPSLSRFYLRNASSSGNANIVFAYGPAGGGWIPLVGDWDGNGTETVGLYDPKASRFYLRNSNSGGNANTTFVYGPAGGGWTPIVGDWDGDGKATIGLYDPTISRFYLRNSNSGGNANVVFAYGAGGGGWKPLAGDWDGNGTTTVGLYDPTISRFYLRNTNAGGNANVVFAYGAGGAGWKPLAGDWDNNGTDTAGVYDPATSRFYEKNSNTPGNANTTFAYGAAGAGWIPMAGDWNGFTPPLQAAGGMVTPTADTTALSASALQPLLTEAIARWAKAGLSASSLSVLNNVSVVIADLPGSYLGTADGKTITIDADAAGHGWFVDPTPTADEEFTSSADGQQLQAVDPRALDRIDLLSVVEHELGHVAGLGDIDALADSVMSATLDAGIRRVPR